MKLFKTSLLCSLLTISVLASPHKDDVAYTPSTNKILAITYTFDKENSNIDDKFYKFTTWIFLFK